MTGRPVAEGILRQMARMDAIASVALSHRDDCQCDVCQAARGDVDAMTRLIVALDEFDA